MVDKPFVLVLCFWMAVLVAFVASAWLGRKPVVGLSLSYLCQLWLTHGLGAIIQLLPRYDSPTRAATVAGFKITPLLLVGFSLGALFIAPRLFRCGVRATEKPVSTSRYQRASVIYFVTGFISYFFLLSILHRIPSTAAIFSSGMALMVASFAVSWWREWTAARRDRSWFVASCILVIPIVALPLTGFLSYAIGACLSFACFVAVFYRPRSTAIAMGVALIFLGLSLYPAYMEARIEIRNSVWGGGSVEESASTTVDAIGRNWAWFNANEDSHLIAIEQRLNQNWLVGHAVHGLSIGRVDYADGETLLDALVAPVPRALWPSKPEWAGSGDLVARYTGLRFAKGTAVGIGHVMELYVNFGHTGLLVGGIVLGSVIGSLDIVAGKNLISGDWGKFVLWFVVGQTLLKPGEGCFAEVTAAAIGAFMLCIISNWLVRTSGKRRTIARPTLIAKGLDRP